MYPNRNTRADLFHIESHAPLLQRTTVAKLSPRALDAIVVPTIRPESLQSSVELARDIGCQLVVLCTTEVQSREVLRQIHLGDTFVTYVPQNAGDGLLDFLTSVHPEIDFETTCHVDIARKRNVGMLLARMCGWRTVMYLDDDIRDLTATAVASAAMLVGPFRAVGFEINFYPDNSVVCHAHRLAGANQSVFPGGSALLVDVAHADSFFPSIYNEDWLFLFDAVKSRSLAVAGNLSQLEYFPFQESARAASEEFGDLIAEGLFRLIHERVNVVDATLDYWSAALRRRGQLIDDVATRLLLFDGDKPVVQSALMSLAAARKRLDAITPLACLSFVRAWRSDLAEWHERLLRLPTLGDVRDAAKFVGLPILEVAQ